MTPIPLESEADPNEEPGYWLRHYRETYRQGSALDATLAERIVRTGKNRRRADRVIWAGLGRPPRRYKTPTIIAEFVSQCKRDRQRDYETKRDEYRKIGVKEYWIIDPFQRTMTVFSQKAGKVTKRLVREHQTYKTPLLPGFELPLGPLLAQADQWADDEDEDKQ